LCNTYHIVVDSCDCRVVGDEDSFRAGLGIVTAG
jgi:hypothetical protein